MNKSTFTSVASIINKEFAKLDRGDFKPRVSVVNTEEMPENMGFDKWSLFVNNDGLSIIEHTKGKAQDMFYSDEVYVVGDNDLYIEPITRGYFGLAKK